MKPLFDENDEYTVKAQEINNEFHIAISAIFKKYSEYSPRHLSLIAGGVAGMIECETVMDNRANRTKKS